MALVRQTFTRAGNAPDVPTLATAVRGTVGDPFYVFTRPGFVDIDKPTGWSGADVTAVQASVAACVDATPQTDAQNAIDTMGIFQKAILLALIDQLNVIRAALPSPLGAITPAQAAAAVRTKAGTL